MTIESQIADLNAKLDALSAKVDGFAAPAVIDLTAINDGIAALNGRVDAIKAEIGEVPVA